MALLRSRDRVEFMYQMRVAKARQKFTVICYRDRLDDVCDNQQAAYIFTIQLALRMRPSGSLFMDCWRIVHSYVPKEIVRVTLFARN
jgi:hypothetical protein